MSITKTDMENFKEQLTTIAENVPKVYQKGYDAGYNAGNAGVNDAYKQGYDQGYDMGKSDGYTDGYEKGYGDGDSVSYTDGYEKGIEEGKKAEYDEFWNSVTANGTRVFYEYAFDQWQMEYMRPPQKIVPTSRMICMFRGNILLKKIEAEYFDFSKADTRDSPETYGHYYTFYDCQALEEIEDIGLKAGYYFRTFNNCFALKKIHVLRVTETTLFSESAFRGCISLEDITIDGTIGQNGFDIHWSNNLSRESIYSIINALSDTTTGLTITLPMVAVQVAFSEIEGENEGLLSTDWQELEVTKPNWTIALS